eukprot:Opistho-2@75995
MRLREHCDVLRRDRQAAELDAMAATEKELEGRLRVLIEQQLFRESQLRDRMQEMEQRNMQELVDQWQREYARLMAKKPAAIIDAERKALLEWREIEARAIESPSAVTSTLTDAPPAYGGLSQAHAGVADKQ